jgi:predicted nucleotide-binding protein
MPVAAATKAVSAHLWMLQEADAALLVAGATGAFNAGLAAGLTNARIWPVACFGGGAQQFLQEMKSLDRRAARVPDRERALKFNSSAESAFEAIREDVTSFPRLMIVHGRSTDRNDVAELLTKNGVSKIDVLIDRSEPGSVIVKEFERFASLSDAAIAVLTPEDLAVETLAPGGHPRDVSAQAPTLRARQNVLLEYGWFWARLGRGMTLLLVKGSVEIPSDLYGVRLVPYSERPAESTCSQAIADFIASVRSGAARFVD